MISMGNCFRCKKSMGRFSFAFSSKDLKKIGVNAPPGMGNDDRICSDCENHLRNPLKAREQEQKNSESRKIMETTRQLGIKGKEYKTKWNKNGIIQFKNERIAILKRMFRSQVEFIVAFDELTEEGYRLMAHDEGTEVAAGGFSGGANSYFYFQRIDYVSVGHQKLKRDTTEKVDAPISRGAL